MQKSYLILGAISFLAAAALATGGVYLAYTTWQMRTTVAEAIVTHAEQEKRSAYSASVRALLRDTTQERALLQSMTAGKDAVDLIRELETLDAQMRITLKIDSVSEGTAVSQDPTLRGYIVTMRAEGAFAGLFGFVRELEYAPVPPRIEQLTFERTKEGWLLSLRAQFLLDAPEGEVQKNI